MPHWREHPDAPGQAPVNRGRLQSTRGARGFPNTNGTCLDVVGRRQIQAPVGSYLWSVRTGREHEDEATVDERYDPVDYQGGAIFLRDDIADRGHRGQVQSRTSDTVPVDDESEQMQVGSQPLSLPSPEVKMTVRTRDELLTALDGGAFDDLLGTAEGDWVDFKSEPYRLEVPKGLWEYAKDVAAFANSQGGLIVVGYKTVKTPVDLESKADVCRMIPKHRVDANRLKDILANTVYPEVRGVTQRWFPAGAEHTEGVLVVEVPQQRDSDHPFILKRVIGTDEKDLHAHAIPIRAGASTNWMRTEALHAALGRGDLRTVLASIDAVLLEVRARLPVLDGARVPAQVAQAAPNVLSRMDERINAICREMEWEETPTYFLQAVPPPGSQLLLNLHGSNGVAGKLVSPPVLRRNGWHPAAGFTPEVRDGGLVIVNGDRAIAWLDRDGFFTSGVVATPDFLGWGMDKRRDGAPGPYTLNSLALVELTLEFFRLVHTVLVPCAPAGGWTARVLARGFRSMSGGVRMSPGPPDVWHQALKPASGDAMDDVYASTGDAGRDAFLALERVYGLFGLSVEDIPFTEDRAVSETAVRAR